MTPRIVILGIGNLLLSDDGAGVHAARALAADPPPGAESVDAGTDVLSALPFLEQATHALILDAVRGGGEPGALYRLAETDLSPRGGTCTAHAVNVLAARHLSPPGTPWPEVCILGVEPASLELGTDLSPAVAAALPQLERLAREQVASWQSAFAHSNPGRCA
jgi:hydrogenase maturation protease